MFGRTCRFGASVVVEEVVVVLVVEAVVELDEVVVVLLVVDVPPGTIASATTAQGPASVVSVNVTGRLD